MRSLHLVNYLSLELKRLLAVELERHGGLLQSWLELHHAADLLLRNNLFIHITKAHLLHALLTRPHELPHRRESVQGQARNLIWHELALGCLQSVGLQLVSHSV